MKTTTLVILAITFFSFSTAHAAPVTFDWATVGNPSNTPDTEVMNDGTTGYGAVANTYRISKTEVTNAQYTEFLNAVADADPNGLYSTFMDSDTRGGITRGGSSGSYTYAVKSDSIGNGPGGADGDDYTYGNKPVVWVSFFDAMRFTNWLENGQPTGAQGASTTEAGVYSIGSGWDEVRNPSATYFIPSENEWYKAAYYDPSGGTYYDYPTSTDMLTDINNNLPSSDTGNSANFWQSGYTTGDFSYPMTDVGAYTASESPYGTYDQGGNVWEWNEALLSSSGRGYRGGGLDDSSSFLPASYRSSINPTSELGGIGFRVASIPEPSSLLLGAMASMGLLVRRRAVGVS
ncbi:MAG: SUMF1/EgtB/PvdO family nonheme iron enzyme [Planctomycetes bacterium]|nr:SUMF1/EgtB/PvdO family nonheme iron enzyme [Planctomycetota bacterium]